MVTFRSNELVTIQHFLEENYVYGGTDFDIDIDDELNMIRTEAVKKKNEIIDKRNAERIEAARIKKEKENEARKARELAEYLKLKEKFGDK